MAIAEIEQEFGDGKFMFRLPPLYLDQLQRKRGTDVTYTDGSTGRRPKPFGQMFREHMTGDYDPLDSLEIIRLGLTAGGGGVVAGEEVKLTSTSARIMVDDVLGTSPVETWYACALNILRACTYGYEPPVTEDKEPGNETPPQTGDTSTSEPQPET